MDDLHDNPFEGLGGDGFNLDDDELNFPLLELGNNSDDEDYFPDVLKAATTALSVRPTERQKLELMTPQQIKYELQQEYHCSGLSYLSEQTQSQLLDNLRRQQDIIEYQTLGSMVDRGEILMPELSRKATALSAEGFITESLTPEEVAKIYEYSSFKPENTDQVLEYVRDIITQSRNGVKTRRDYRDFDPETAGFIEDTLDKINNYLDNGGYEAEAENLEYGLTDVEREHLIDLYGPMEEFDHCDRETLIELGYLDEDTSITALGPLSQSELDDLESAIRPSFADMTSSRSIKRIGKRNPRALYIPKPADSLSLIEATVYKYTEQEIEKNRLIEAKPLISGFAALELDFIQSNITKRVKDFLKIHPNDEIEKTLNNLRLMLMQGGRICNLLTGGSDTDAKKRFGSRISFKPDFVSEILEKSESLSDISSKRITDFQYEYLEKLDTYYEQARLTYATLEDLLEIASTSANAEGDTENNRAGSFSNTTFPEGTFRSIESEQLEDHGKTSNERGSNLLNLARLELESGSSDIEEIPNQD